MFEKTRAWLLKWLRVPPEPEPPFGDPASVRVFRASRRFYLLRLARWGIGQAFALAGLIFWLTIMVFSEYEAGRVRAQGANGGSLASLPAGRNRVYTGPLGKVSPRVFHWLWVAKGVGLLIYLGQLAITYAALRLDWEMRWYIVTDRSLRIRSGVWSVQEVTMSYANLQQVMVSQGPLQQLMKIADVRVESAGGGGSAAQAGNKGHTDTMHCGVFHGVDNANEIRDLILARLRRYRESGLGDPDEAHAAAQAEGEPEADIPAQGSGELMAAAREMLVEARALRSAAGKNV